MAGTFWHSLNPAETIRVLRSDPENGLSEKEADFRRKKFGKNELPEEKPLSRLRIFLDQLRSPLILILAVSGLITFFLKEYADTVIIFSAVFLNAAVGFIQENKASQTLKALKKAVKQKAKVLREGNLKVIEANELVPGDIIALSPGDKVPADARLFSFQDLKINEMVLTGEWFASNKTSGPLPRDAVLADRENMAYFGSLVEEGNGRAVVTETGHLTEMGKIASLVRETEEEKTPYQKKLIHFSRLVGLLIGLISFGIFVEGLLTGGEFVEMFTTAVAVAVAAIPEGLPVAMTVILALGMQKILKRQGLVRKLTAAESLGSASVIATDKTATLTEGRMKVAEIIGDRDRILKAAFLISEAFIENPRDPKSQWRIHGKPTDKAFFEAGVEAGLLNQKNQVLAKIPFRPQNKFSAVLLEEESGERTVYACGAPEKISALANLTEEEKTDLEGQLENLAQRGLRVVASAYRKLGKRESGKLADLCENLVLAGLLALNDPLRPEAKEAIRICREAGLKPIIVTGDHRLTARAVAQEIGLESSEQNILEGKDLDSLSPEDLTKILPQISVYARVEPRHKLKIIAAWQERGEVVAMTGDGINDAPALKKADIGIALGSGTEAAKETADLVLLNDSFSIIVKAIEEGRAILDNIRKVITYLLSDSFTEVILIGGSALVSWLTNQPLVLPVLAGQILWVNLIEDGPLGLALAFEPKEKNLMSRRPQSHRVSLLTPTMKTLIFIIGFITDLLLLGLFFWLTKYSSYEIPHIRSIMFAGLAIDSVFFVFSCKSLNNNLWKINPFNNKFLIFAWLGGIIMLLVALYLPFFQALLKTVPLNFFDWQVILGLGLLNIFLIEITKWFFIKKNAETF